MNEWLNGWGMDGMDGLMGYGRSTFVCTYLGVTVP